MDRTPAAMHLSVCTRHAKPHPSAHRTVMRMCISSGPKLALVCEGVAWPGMTAVIWNRTWNVWLSKLKMQMTSMHVLFEMRECW